MLEKFTLWFDHEISESERYFHLGCNCKWADYSCIWNFENLNCEILELFHVQNQLCLYINTWWPHVLSNGGAGVEELGSAEPNKIHLFLDELVF
jgi:hypothetical protein